MSLKKVYCCGAYSAPNVIKVMEHCRRGIDTVCRVRQAGFATYNPWADLLEHLHCFFSLEDSYRHSMTWLEACDALLLIPEDAEQSHGVQAELVRAKELGIPIFRTINDLIAWRDEQFTIEQIEIEEMMKFTQGFAYRTPEERSVP